MKDKYFFFFLVFILNLQLQSEAINHSLNEQLLSIQTDVQEAYSKIKYFESDLSLVFDRITEIEKNIKKIETNNKIQIPQKDKENIYQELSSLKNHVQDIQRNVNDKLIAAQQSHKKLIEEVSSIKRSLTAMLNYLELNENLILESEKKIYVVEAGETLSTISKKLKIPISELKATNKITNDKIYAGQKLILPNK